MTSVQCGAGREACHYRPQRRGKTTLFNLLSDADAFKGKIFALVTISTGYLLIDVRALEQAAPFKSRIFLTPTVLDNVLLVGSLRSTRFNLVSPVSSLPPAGGPEEILSWWGL
jgi:ABC-type branched-subunit amino acid transport system ATPase component